MKAHMASEISRMEDIGYKGWTEYRVLILDLLRVEPMSPQELVARARNTIDGLREYADDTEHPYPKEDFSKIENQFRRLIDDVERPGKLSPDAPTAAIEAARSRSRACRYTPASRQERCGRNYEGAYGI